MADPIKIDSHIHIYQEASEGIAAKEGYEIWEYGAQDRVDLSDLAGTIEELVQAMDEADIAKGVIVNLFIAAEAREKYRDALPADQQGSDKVAAEIETRLRDDFQAFNRWACGVAAEHAHITPFVCADVALFNAEDCAAHVRDMIENHGARGVKLHGPGQEFFMGDEKLWPTYATCQGLGLPVIGHSGPDREGKGFAEPRAFGAVLSAFPDLTIVLAHMGGATWQQAQEVAEGYDNAYFDCCEIIEWTHSENGPTDTQLGQLIHDIGAHRVMMGSDYPWYDLDRTVERVMELPVLSQEEKDGIVGANAERILGI